MSDIKNIRTITVTNFVSATGSVGVKWTSKIALGFNPDVICLRSLSVLGGEATAGRFTYALRSNIEKNNDILVIFRLGAVVNYNDLFYNPNLFNLDNGVATFEILQTDSSTTSTSGNQNWVPATNLNSFCSSVFALQFIEYEK